MKQFFFPSLTQFHGTKWNERMMGETDLFQNKKHWHKGDKLRTYFKELMNLLGF